MKATNLILIVAFLAFAATGFSTNDVDPRDNPFTVTISLEKAIDNPRLVTLMHQQLNPDFLTGPFSSKIIKQKVKSRLAVYVIYGSLAEWKAFFGKRPIVDKER